MNGIYKLILSVVLIQSSFDAKKITEEQLNKAFGECGVRNSIAEGENISCSDALPFINEAVEKYGLKTNSQKAFYLSTMAIESGKLTYNKNHYPGRPGQGTRSMMMPNNLYAFAKDSKDIQDRDPTVKELVSKSYDENDNQSKERLLTELMKNEYSFRPGAWWIARGAGQMNNACTTFSSKLANESGSEEAIKSLLRDCVGVEPNEERISAYNKALNALQ